MNAVRIMRLAAPTLLSVVPIAKPALPGLLALSQPLGFSPVHVEAKKKGE